MSILDLPTLIISFSGGRTSGYMAKWCLDKRAEKDNLRVIGMNTGSEHPETLIFVDKCDKELGLNLIWLEAVIHPKKGDGTTYKVIDFESASRECEPFYAMIRKYGIPNQGYPHCNRELKLAPFDKWVADNVPDASRAIGIRVDEIDRMSKPAYMEAKKITYPLIKLNPTRKGDVLGWWGRQEFDLQIPEHKGNCVTCWKKSEKKLLTLAHEDPKLFDHFDEMEKIAKEVGSNEPKNSGVFFREHMTSKDIVKASEESFIKFRDKYFETHSDQSNGCSESCEVDEGETADLFI